jgi:spermidine synthase
MKQATVSAEGAIRNPRSGLLRHSWIHLVVFASGFAGLGYEMVWSKMLAVSLGHEIIAVLAVLAAFFAGLSLGAFTLGNRIRRSARPARWYIVLEVVIGAWAIALIGLMPWFNATVPAWIGETPVAWSHWSIAFGSTLVLLMPATAAMGATLPAIERIYGSVFGAGRHVGGVYAANTFGAVLGALFSTFVLAPMLGFSVTLGLFALVNLGCALAIHRLAPHEWQTENQASQPVQSKSSGDGLSQRRLLITLFCTGLLGLGYEVLVIRVLSQVLEDTVFTFAVILSIYLLGTAAGAAFYQQRLADNPPPHLLSLLLVLTASACLFGSSVLWLSDTYYDWATTIFSHSMITAIGGEVTLAVLVFLLPTLAMGALFSHLAQDATTRFGLGQALGINTLGAAIAPFAAGVILLPAGGAQPALIILALGYLLLLPTLSVGNLRWVAVPMTGALLLAMLPPLRFVEIPEGGKLIDYRDGVMAAVAVVSDNSDTRYLKVNNHFSMGSTSSRFADHRQTHIPLLLHDDPRSVLYLGVGTGMTINAAQYHPHLDVTAVELVPEVLEILGHFGTEPQQNNWTNPPEFLASDARRFVVSSDSVYDVIIADLFHPSRDGAGSLYTREHFEAIKQRLAPNGIFVQWLPLFQMDLDTFKIVARTFADRFPHVQVHLPHFSLRQPIIGLFGSTSPLEFGRDRLINRVTARPLQRQLVSLRLNSDLSLYGGFIADRKGLLTYAGDAPLNTDDHTLVTYRAPAFAYTQKGAHGERLVELVDALASDRGIFLMAADSDRDMRFEKRLESYWKARDAYLRAGLDVYPTDDLLTLLEKTREPLLDIVRISSDFTSAYMPLLAMAESLDQLDPPAARALLRDLDEAAPSRSEAKLMLQALSQR